MSPNWFAQHQSDRANAQNRTRGNAAQRAAEDDVMTDEAYIDDLFAREGIGWDKTPGFRAFVLDLMGIIGERPRAGDVSSMHLAYTAGLEHGKEWTDKRPTEAGEYWVSVVPRNRKTYRMSSVDAVVIDKSLFASLTDQTWIGYVSHSIFDGAKWSRRETPADPFEEG